MRVQIKFFAIFREMIGLKAESKEIAENTTVEQLWHEYAARSPRAENIRAAYAVNQKLVNGDHVLRDGDEVGFLPPVSGGQGKSKESKVQSAQKDAKGTRRKSNRGDSRDSRIRKDAIITPKPLDLGAFVQRVAFSGAGAIVTFSGVVRDNARGKSVKYLEYEAYVEMAEQSLLEIIAVAAPHRAEAYAASRYAIERIKAVLPVWKKEFAVDGASWVEGPVAGELSAEQAEAVANQAEE